MWEVLDVLRRLGRRESQVGAAAATGLGRKAIRHYLRRARELGWNSGVEEPDEALAVRVLERVRPGRKEPEPGGDRRPAALPSGADPAMARRIGARARPAAHRGLPAPGAPGHRSSRQPAAPLRRHALSVRTRADDRAPCRPGEPAEINFGRLGYILDPQTGRRQLLWALVVILAYSRHMYVHVTRRQTLADVVVGLEAVWEFFGGVTARAIVDNLRAAIAKASCYEAVFQRTFAEYAEHRGFVIDPAAAQHPTGQVARRTPGSLRAGELLPRRELSRHRARPARRNRLVLAGRRHPRPRHHAPSAAGGLRGRRARRAAAPRSRSIQHAAVAECGVPPDHHVQFRRALYSVPSRHGRKPVVVRGDRALVRIFFLGKLIKVHPTQPPGGHCTDYDDYLQDRGAYARRDPDYMIAEARKLRKRIGRFTKELLVGEFPWATLRQAQKLLRLGKKYGAPRLEEACARALAFDLIINVRGWRGSCSPLWASLPPCLWPRSPRHSRAPDHGSAVPPEGRPSAPPGRIPSINEAGCDPLYHPGRNRGLARKQPAGVARHLAEIGLGLHTIGGASG